MPFIITHKDITKLSVDAIVNAANTELQMGGGVCGAIFRAAGARELQESCDALAPIETGQAVITPGFRLPAKYIIHTAGPIYSEWSPDESKALLQAAYRSSLELAREYGLQSVAFPLISSGIYGYPKEAALQDATEAIRQFLVDHDMDVYLIVFDKEALLGRRELFEEVEAYLEDNFEPHSKRELQRSQMKQMNRASADTYGYMQETHYRKILSIEVDDPLALDESFSKALLRIIDEKGLSDVEVYKKANIDRKLFSKIRSNEHYTPSKRTAIALCLALELNLEETDDLLERAGYALSHSQKFDVIVEYFIIREIYDIYQINEVLFQYDQVLLGV